MNWEQMKQRCPSARFVGVGRLKDHRLAITRKSRRRLCGTADVIEERGSDVWGIVYDIDEAEFFVLDDFEDGYRRESMNILLDGLERQAWIYIAEKESCPPPPSAHYKRLMLEGARQWRLPPAYIAYLEQIEAVED